MSVHNGDNSDPTKSTWNKYYQKKNANNNLEKYRDELVSVFQDSTKNTKKPNKIIFDSESDYDDIPQETSIGYNSNKYMGASADRVTVYPPSNFTVLDKSSYNEGWILTVEDKDDEWRRKYCILMDKMLFVYDEDKLHLRKPNFILNFDQQLFILEVPDKNSLLFNLKEGGRNQTFRFMAENFSLKDKWLSCLSVNLEASCGVKEKLYKYSRVSEFWKKMEVSVGQISSMAKSGDILLFKSNNGISGVQRFLTSSEYDHVAMFIWSNDGFLSVLESSGGTGVELNPWKMFIDRNWLKLYEKVSYRRLSCRRDAMFYNNLEQFISENIGKQYELTFGKLFKFQSVLPQDGQDRNNHKYDSFFCSELVAAAMKACGLLSLKVSSSQYWPVTFTDKNTIDFLNGGKLEAEMILNLNL